MESRELQKTFMMQLTIHNIAKRNLNSLIIGKGGEVHMDERSILNEEVTLTNLDVVSFEDAQEMEDVINGASFGVVGCCVF